MPTIPANVAESMITVEEYAYLIGGEVPTSYTNFRHTLMTALRASTMPTVRRVTPSPAGRRSPLTEEQIWERKFLSSLRNNIEGLSPTAIKNSTSMTQEQFETAAKSLRDSGRVRMNQGKYIRVIATPAAGRPRATRTVAKAKPTSVLSEVSSRTLQAVQACGGTANLENIEGFFKTQSWANRANHIRIAAESLVTKGYLSGSGSMKTAARSYTILVNQQTAA